jgi:serine/threonine protein kinase
MNHPLLSEALLRCASRRGWTVTQAADLGLTPAQRSELLPPPHLPPFGRWQALARLGGGAMGAVWLAAATDGPLVVIKTAAAPARSPLGGDPGGSVWNGGDEAVPRRPQESELAARFEREARITASLQHPRIVPCLDGGVAADGTRYLVLEWIASGDLAAMLRRYGRLSADCGLAIADQLADALDHAHARGVIHRDLKAANVFVRDDGAVLLGDFGLARPSSIGASRLTLAGVAVGTPNGMAPEQIDGRDSLDGRADLYALGCLLFECLAGRPPFSGRSNEVMHAHRTAPPPDLDRLVPGLPAGVAGLVTSLMAKRPEDRPADGAAVRAALAACGVIAGRLVPCTGPQVSCSAIVIEMGEQAAVLWAQPRIVLGKQRGPGTDLVVRDYPEEQHRERLQRISRRHAAISRHEDGWCVEDLGSSNGTCINGTRLTPGTVQHLVDGDRIELAGVTSLTVRLAPSAVILQRPDNRTALSYAIVDQRISLGLQADLPLSGADRRIELARHPGGWQAGGQPLAGALDLGATCGTVRELGDWL